LEASVKMAGKLAPGRQSDRGVNTRADVRYQVAGFAGSPPSVPHARPRDRRVIAEAAGTKAG
jgi:hypothetical protein